MKNLTIEKKGNIAIVTVNRPKELNSMNAETRKELALAFETLDEDNNVKVSILTGAIGKAFIAGADVKEFSRMEISDRKVMEEDWRVTNVISKSKTPVIAMINGFCLGGGLKLQWHVILELQVKIQNLDNLKLILGLYLELGELKD